LFLNRINGSSIQQIGLPAVRKFLLLLNQLPLDPDRVHSGFDLVDHGLIPNQPFTSLEIDSPGIELFKSNRDFEA